VAVAVALGSASAVRAAEVDFRPVMSFGIFHDGNIAVTGQGAGDDVASLSFDLAVDRKTPTSTFSFAYRPSYVAYRKSDGLDYFANTLILGYGHEASRNSQFSVDLYASRTDYQGRTAATADRATTFVPRTTLTQIYARASGSSGAGKRGILDWQVRASTDRYKDLADNPATVVDVSGVNVPDPVNFNDTTALGGRLAWRSELSARTTLGAGLDADQFGYEIGPSVTIASLVIVGTWQPNERWSLDYFVGGSRASSDSNTASGLSFDARVGYTTGKESTFSGGARQVFAPGTGLGGSTQDRGVWLSYAHAPSARGLSGSVLGGYWQRAEVDFTSSSTSPADTVSASLGGGIGWNFNRFVALDANYVFVDQKAQHGAPASLDTNYSLYGVFLRWAIRGR